MIETTIRFAAVRKTTDSGKEWIDHGTISGVKELAEQRARVSDIEAPGWRMAHPVVRITQVEIREVAAQEQARRRPRHAA